MSTNATLPNRLEAKAEMETVADLLVRLGGVAPGRILMNPLPGMATEKDLLCFEGRADKRLCELIDGTLVEKAMGIRESMFAVFVASLIDAFVRLKNLGLVATADGMVRMISGRIRIPDVAFFAWDRLPDRTYPTEPIAAVAPNLAIEILSRSNTAEEMRLKRIDYFDSGVELVWEIDPNTRIVRVYSGVNAVREFSAGDELDGGLVLAGFVLPLATLFGELDRRG